MGRVKVKVYQPLASEMGREESGPLEFQVDLDGEMSIEQVLSLHEVGESLLSLLRTSEWSDNIMIALDGEINYDGLSAKVSAGEEIQFFPLYGGG